MSKIVINDLLVQRGEFQLGPCHFELAAGEILGVMGRSGSGKTSLLHAIAGFIPLTQGSIMVDERKLDLLPPEQRNISMVFQKPWIFENLNVIENVEFGLKIQRQSAQQARKIALDWLRKLEISELAERMAWQVSGGQAQRVVIARALAVGFPLILLDEPFSALDGVLRRDLRKTIKRLIKEEQYSACFVSHHWKDVKETSDKVLVFHQGKVIAYGSVSEIEKSKNALVRELSSED